MSGWSPAGSERFRLYEGPLASPAVQESSLQSVASPSAVGASEGKLLSLDNPLTAVALIGALTFGFMAFATSGSVRVGKTKLGGSLNVGTT